MKVAAFDSGIGGLTALAPLLKNYSGLDVTYLGDLANLPYGTKSPERIQQLVKANIEWLLEKDKFEVLILACNTASAYALELSKALCKKKGVHCEGVIGPGCRLAAKNQHKRIIILATAATVSSQAYERGLHNESFQGEIIQIACPLFVPLVEEAFTSGAAVEEIIQHYLEPTLQNGDTVILGCTHYPLLLKSFQKLYPSVNWIDAGAALKEENLVQNATGKSKLKLLFTDKIINNNKIEFFLNSLELEHTANTIHSINPIL